MRSTLHVADYGGQCAGVCVNSLVAMDKYPHEDLNTRFVLILADLSPGKEWLNLLSGKDITFYFLEKTVSGVKRVIKIKEIALKSGAVLFQSPFTTFDMEAAFVALTLNIPTVRHIHSDWGSKSGLARKLKDLTKFRLVGRMDVEKILCVSDGVKKNILSCGASDAQCVTMYDGIDTLRFSLLVSSCLKVVLRMLCRITKNSFLFLMFGWSPFTKGVVVVCEAMGNSVSKTNRNIMLLVIWVVNTQAYVHSCLQCTFNFVKVIPPVEKVEDFYSMSDCYISASRTEAFSNAIEVAMASGLAVISSDIEHLKQIYSKCSGCITFESGSPDDLARVLRNVCHASADTRAKCGASNKEFIRANLSVGHWCNSITTLYSDVLGKQR